MSISIQADTRQLLPEDRIFYDLLWPYATPYLIYVAISSIPETILPLEIGQALKLAATGAAMLAFRKQYHFGPLKPAHGLFALLALPVALICWIAPFYLLAALSMADVMSAGDPSAVSSLSFYLRLFNSVILVALFEESFTRVFVLGWLHQAGPQRRQKGLLGAVVDTLDQRPQPLAVLPLSLFSVAGATLVFAAGHQAHEYPSAILYFLFTTWVYKKTGSLWVCILVHGLTNLAVALLARYGGLGWLW